MCAAANQDRLQHPEMPRYLRDELDQTVRDHYALLVQRGAKPRRVVGGIHDGLAYFVRIIGGEEYLLTTAGLLQRCGNEMLRDG
jgi:hypothetical protein